MKGTRAALRYAKAVLNLAKEKGFAKEVNDDMILIQSTIEENHDLEIMLKSPVIKSGPKRAVLAKVFEKKVNGITMGLLDLLIENKRLPILNLVAKEYVVIYDFLKGIEVAQITSAVPLTKELETEILNKIRFDEEAEGIAIWSSDKNTLEKIGRLITVLKNDDSILLESIKIAEKNGKME